MASELEDLWHPQPELHGQGSSEFPLDAPQEPVTGPPWAVHFTYFKASGKYYSRGRHLVYVDDIRYILEFIEHLWLTPIRPGLPTGSTEFYALVTVPGHPDEIPVLKLPKDRSCHPNP